MAFSFTEERLFVRTIRRATAHVNAARVELALKRLELARREAKFDPNQPRVPAGNRDGGQWTTGGGGSGPGINDRRVLSDARPDDEWRAGAQYAQVRPPRAQFPGATPAQNARLAAAEWRQNAAVSQVRQVDPNWRPRTEHLTAPGSIEGAIARAEARAIEAETRLRDLARQPHGKLLQAYRESNAPPDLFGRGWPRESNTVAVATPEGRLFFGMNSGAPTYTSKDRAEATRTLESMAEQFPRAMYRDAISEWPNYSLLHAESTIFLRIREAFGGKLAGRTFQVTVDRPMCVACEVVLPRLGVHLGNPRVTWFDQLGLKGIMQYNNWLFLRPR